MQRQPLLIAYILIGLGIYFLIKQLEFVFFQPFIGWPTILAIVGISFLLHSYTAREKQNLFLGVLLIGLGVHFHGLQQYDFWYDHWSIYTLIVGISLLFRYFQTKKGLLISSLLIIISTIMIFSISLPDWFQPIYSVIDFIETFWPIILIIIGLFLLRKRS